jgi:septal ring factor EnvC (AmiA/AmiB activator)
MHKIKLMPHKNKALVMLIVALALLLAQGLARAKDLSDEQYQVRAAQKEYDLAYQDHQVLSSAINEMQKRIAQQTQQLDTIKKDLPTKEARLNKAQKMLEEKQAILDKAWDENQR